MKINRFVVSFCALAGLQFASQLATAQSATDLTCNGCVNSGDIANGTIKAEDLSTNAVETAKVRNNAITYAKLSPGIKAQIDGAVDEVNVTLEFGEAAGFAGVPCPEGRFAVAASCACVDDGGAPHPGGLNFCAAVGDGALAACSFDAMTFDELLGDPIAQVQATCLGVTSNDGTPWVPVPAGLARFDASSPDAAQSVEQQAKWRKEQHDAYEKAIAEQRAKFADYKRRVSSR